MVRWTCPNCKRVFGRKNQSHTLCKPGLSLAAYFDEARPFEQPIFDAVHSGIGHLEGLIVDPIDIGILLKNGPMFAELRPKTKWTALGFGLDRKLESGRLSRKVVEYGNKFFHVINVDDPAMVDDEIVEWLIEGYHLAGGTLASYRSGHADSGGDGMVPDDVDDELS